MAEIEVKLLQSSLGFLIKFKFIMANYKYEVRRNNKSDFRDDEVLLKAVLRC